MRWFFIILLGGNFIYLGWEITRETQIAVRNQALHHVTTPGVTSMQIISPDDTPPVKVPRAEVIDNEDIDIIFSQGVTGDNEIASVGDELVTDILDFSLTPVDETIERTFCFSFGPVAEEVNATALNDWFNSRRAKTRTRFIDEEGKQLFWIYLSPEESRDDAIDTLRELQQKGVGDYRLINHGDLQNAISLGLYSSQASVNQRLLELEDKGYKPVIVPYYDGKRTYFVDVRFRINPELLENIFNGYPSRYEYVPVNCDNIAMTETR